jgi:hypothetical protein
MTTSRKITLPTHVNYYSMINSCNGRIHNSANHCKLQSRISYCKARISILYFPLLLKLESGIRFVFFSLQAFHTQHFSFFVYNKICRLNNIVQNSKHYFLSLYLGGFLEILQVQLSSTKLQNLKLDDISSYSGSLIRFM